MRTGRAAWLILAADGPATELVDRVKSTVVRVVADPRRFRDVLLAERPRIVVCAQPPADAEALALVAAERRRRSGMRAVHLAPPDAVEDRRRPGAWLRRALATNTAAAELAGRLAWLDTRSRTARVRPRSWPSGRTSSSTSRHTSCDGDAGHPPSTQGVRAPCPARRPSGPRLHATRAPPCRLGPGPHRRTAHGRRPRALAGSRLRPPLAGPARSLFVASAIGSMDSRNESGRQRPRSLPSSLTNGSGHSEARPVRNPHPTEEPRPSLRAINQSTIAGSCTGGTISPSPR